MFLKQRIIKFKLEIKLNLNTCTLYIKYMSVEPNHMLGMPSDCLVKLVILHV